MIDQHGPGIKYLPFGKVGERYATLESVNPNREWVNVNSPAKHRATLKMLSPIRDMPPMSSIAGFMYTSISSATMAHTIIDKEHRDRVRVRGYLEDISQFPRVRNTDIPSVIPLIHFLIWERVCLDINYRKDVIYAVDEDVALDTYNIGTMGATHNFFTPWYPRIINRVLWDVYNDTIPDFSLTTRDKTKPWYTGLIEVDETQFNNEFANLVSIYQQRVAAITV